jgi:hypothetical protein
VTITANPSALRQHATKEVALFVGLLFLGLVVMPLVIYSVGQSVFGNYGGVGYNDFYGTLSGKVRNGDLVAWFLILSPYLGWQIIRLMTLAWRFSDRKDSTA